MNYIFPGYVSFYAPPPAPDDQGAGTSALAPISITAFVSDGFSALYVIGLSVISV